MTDPEPYHVEAARLREALERIRDHGLTHDKPCWAIHRGDCADAMQEIARAALQEGQRG